MDKRKKLISILAGLMALIMILGLIAGFIPTAHAASSSELKAELDALNLFSFVPFTELLLPMIATFGACGLFVGILGSWTSIRKFLDV